MANPMGKRYDDDEQREIAKFIREYDREHGRGGKSAACKKWGLAPMTAARFAKRFPAIDTGAPSDPQPKQRKILVAKTAQEKVLMRMLQILKEVGDLQEQYDELKAQL